MTSSFCSYYNEGRCRSCGWIETDYAEQLLAKERKIQEALSFFPPFTLESTVRSSTEGFRNRAKMTVTGTSEKPVIGLLGEGALDEGRELLSCPIHHPKLNELMENLPEWIHRFNLIPYRIKERQGELKGLIAFYSPLSDQMYLRFVLRSKECVARIRKLMPALQRRFPSLVCISANIQPIPHAILEGPEEIILTEQGFMDHRIGPLLLKLVPQAFVQTNVEVATALYATATRWIGECRSLRMLDLYCGQGAFSFFVGHGAREILGIEINEDAVRTAQETALRLDLTHVNFKVSDATRVQKVIEEYQPDLILANPPRKGLAGGAELIHRAAPRHFIYSSCSIESLASDLRKFSGEYHIRGIRLLDMFPHTEHFETLVWLERN